MLDSKDVLMQIQQLTVDMIESGLCDAQNFPSLKQSPGGNTTISK